MEKALSARPSSFAFSAALRGPSPSNRSLPTGRHCPQQNGRWRCFADKTLVCDRPFFEGCQGKAEGGGQRIPAAERSRVGCRAKKQRTQGTVEKGFQTVRRPALLPGMPDLWDTGEAVDAAFPRGPAAELLPGEAANTTAGLWGGLNNKARVPLAPGFARRSYDVLETALHHTLGDLPKPPFPHRYCGGGIVIGIFSGGIGLRHCYRCLPTNVKGHAPPPTEVNTETGAEAQTTQDSADKASGGGCRFSFRQHFLCR